MSRTKGSVNKAKVTPAKCKKSRDDARKALLEMVSKGGGILRPRVFVLGADAEDIVKTGKTVETSKTVETNKPVGKDISEGTYVANSFYAPLQRISAILIKGIAEKLDNTVEEPGYRKMLDAETYALTTIEGKHFLIRAEVKELSDEPSKKLVTSLLDRYTERVN